MLYKNVVFDYSYLRVTIAFAHNHKSVNVFTPCQKVLLHKQVLAVALPAIIAAALLFGFQSCGAFNICDFVNILLFSRPSTLRIRLCRVKSRFTCAWVICNLGSATPAPTRVNFFVLRSQFFWVWNQISVFLRNLNFVYAVLARRWIKGRRFFGFGRFIGVICSICPIYSRGAPATPTPCYNAILVVLQIGFFCVDFIWICVICVICAIRIVNAIKVINAISGKISTKIILKIAIVKSSRGFSSFTIFYWRVSYIVVFKVFFDLLNLGSSSALCSVKSAIFARFSGVLASILAALTCLRFILMRIFISLNLRVFLVSICSRTHANQLRIVVLQIIIIVKSFAAAFSFGIRLVRASFTRFFRIAICVFTKIVVVFKWFAKV